MYNYFNCLAHMSHCNCPVKISLYCSCDYGDLLNACYAFTWGNHTVFWKQMSSRLLMYGCEWLLCCSPLPFSFAFFPTSSPPFMSGLNHRAPSLSRLMDQEGTVGWHLLALSRLPRYQAGAEQSLSQKPWRACSVENRRWSPTAKRQLAGECCYGGSQSSAP